MGADAGIGGAQVLGGAVEDRAGRLDRPLVVDIDVGAHARVGPLALLDRIEPPVVRLVGDRAVVRQGDLADALGSHHLGIHGLAVADEHRIPVAAVIVDGHMPLEDAHLPAHRDRDRVGEDAVRDPHMGELVAVPAQRPEPEPEWGGLDGDVRRGGLPHQLGDGHVGVRDGVAELQPIRAVLSAEEAMQERRMRRVDADLVRLQPVAPPHALEREHLRARRHEAVQAGKLGRIAPAQVRPHDAIALGDRVVDLTHPRVERRRRRLCRCLETRTVHIEEPPVERAAQAAVFHPAIRQIDATVGALAPDHAQPALVVAKQHEVLAQQANRDHRPVAVEFLRERRRLPVPAQHVASRRPRPALGQEPVLISAHHASSPAASTRV